MRVPIFNISEAANKRHHLAFVDRNVRSCVHRRRRHVADGDCGEMAGADAPWLLHRKCVLGDVEAACRIAVDDVLQRLRRAAVTGKPAVGRVGVGLVRGHDQRRCRVRRIAPAAVRKGDRSGLARADDFDGAGHKQASRVDDDRVVESGSDEADPREPRRPTAHADHFAADLVGD